MVDKPEKKGSKGPEDVERNPRAAASAEAHEAERKASAATDGKQPMRVEELLKLGESNPHAKELVEGLARLNKTTDEKERKELTRWLTNTAQIHFGRDLADLKHHHKHDKAPHDDSIAKLLRHGQDLIKFSGQYKAFHHRESKTAHEVHDKPVHTHELHALRNSDKRQDKSPGFTDQAISMLKSLKDAIMPGDLKKAAEKELRQSIADQLGPQLKDLRGTKSDVTQNSETTTEPVKTKLETAKQAAPEPAMQAPQPEAGAESKVAKPLESTVTSYSPEILTNVQLLNKALHTPGAFGLPIGEHVDFKALKEIADGLHTDKRQLVLEAYIDENPSHHAFFDDLRWLAGDHPVEVREIEEVFERKKDLTNWAGDLKNDLVRLEELKKTDLILSTVAKSIPNMQMATEFILGAGFKDPQVASVERAMRHTVATMPSQAILDMQSDDRGKDILKQVTTSPIVSEDTRAALKIMLDEPLWATKSESVKKLASLALQYNNFDLFKDTMRFASDGARAAFAKSPEAEAIAVKYSLGKEVVKDLIDNGSESMATQLHQNTSMFGWFGANREEVRRLVEFADPPLRNDYTLGERLSKQKHLTPAEKEIVDNYRVIDDALKQATLWDKTEYDVLKHKMMGAPEIYTDLRNLHNNGFFDMFQKNDMNGMKKVVEKLSEENWKSLRDNREHLNVLDEDLKGFLNALERAQVMQMLREKVGVEGDKLTYEKSKEKGKRSIDEFFHQEVPEESWNLLSQAKCRVSKLERILEMTPAEREAYRKDQKHVEKLIAAELQGDELLVARRKLSQILKGEDKDDPVNEALLAHLKKEDNATQSRRLEAALATIDLKHLEKSTDKADIELRESIKAIIKQFCDDTGHGFETDEDGRTIQEGDYDKYYKKIFETGTVSLDLKGQFIKSAGVSFEDLKHLSAEDRQKLLAKNDPVSENLQNQVFKSKEQAALAREILALKNPEKLPEVMRIRAAVVGFDEPIGKVVEKLAAMNRKEREQLEKEYLRYHSTLSTDLLHTATGADRRKVIEIFSPVTMGQTLTNERSSLSKQNGAADPLLIGGAQDAHAKAEKVYIANKETIAKLDPKVKEELKAALENYFAAKANYVSTKRETAEAAAEASTILMAVALSIADPPATAAILASAGVAGAGVKLQMTRAMMGSDFDESQSLKIAGSGFLDVSFGFADKVIPLNKLITIDSKIAAEASQAVCKRVAAQSAEQVVSAETKSVLEQGMARMSRTHCAFGSKEFDHEVHKLAASLLKPGADKHAVEQLAQMIKEETRERISASMQQKVRNELYKMGETATTETGAEVTKEGILHPEKMKADELGIKSTSEMAKSLLKCMEFRIGSYALGKLSDHTNLQLAKRDLFTAAKESLPKPEYLRVIAQTRDLEKRIDNPKIAAQAIREVSSFFKPRDVSFDVIPKDLPDEQALKYFGQATLHDIAYPYEISQGINPTCNTAVVQKHLAFHAPHRYAQIMYDAAGRDRFALADGTVLTPSSFGAFSIDEEVKKYTNKIGCGTNEDLKRVFYRSPTGKAMQTLGANAYWHNAKREFHVMEQGEDLILCETPVEGSSRRLFDGEIAYVGHEKGNVLCYKKGDKWEPFRPVKNESADESSPMLSNDTETNSEPYFFKPQIGSEHIQHIYNKMAGPGNSQSDLVVIGSAREGTDPSAVAELSKHQTFLTSVDDLKSHALRRQTEGRGPTAVAVENSKLNSSNKPGPHVILAEYNLELDNFTIYNSNSPEVSRFAPAQFFECLLEESLDGTN